MSAAKTILRNALFSYGRTLIAAALTLFSSRWVLADLGSSDYGIYGLVGGLLVFIGFISGVLSQGANRFMAYAIGQNDRDEVCRWFNAAANIYFCLPFLLIPLGIFVGDYFVYHVLSIPSDRLDASIWILRCTLVSFSGTLFSMPYQSLLNAKQYIHLSAMIMLSHSFGMFGISILLPHLPGDHLVAYAGCVTMSLLLMQSVYIVVCRRFCLEGRISLRYWWDWRRIKELACFSGWLFVGAFGLLLKGQGISILVNRMKGTSANAGQSVGIQLSGQTEALYNSFVMALNPEITRREGAGSHDQMISLSKKSTRLGLLIVMMVALPLFFECEYVLRLWLKNPPTYAVFFTRLQLVIAIINKMRIGHMMCFQAMGKVKIPQIIDSGFYIATILVIGGMYLVTHSLETSFYGYVGFHFCYMMVYAYAGSRTFDWSLVSHFVKIVLPVIGIGVLGSGVHQVISCLHLDIGFVRLLLTTALEVSVVMISFYLVVFEQSDKDMVWSVFTKLRQKLGLFKGVA